MKTWNLVLGVLFVLLGFCAGVVLNVFPINTTVQGAPEPPATPPAALKSVAHNATLTGDGTTTTPLGIANGGVTAPKLSAAAIPTAGQVLGFNGANLAWQIPPVGGVRVVDSLGHDVGPLVMTAGGPTVSRKLGTFTFLLDVGTNGFIIPLHFPFYHTTSDCSGPRYILIEPNSFWRGSTNIGTQLFYAVDPPQQITVNSIEYFTSPTDPNQPGPCQGFGATTFSGGLVATFDLSTLGLVPPFRLQF